LVHAYGQAPDGFLTSRPCNHFPCPDALTSWSVEPWGPCIPVVTPSRPCKGGPGVQSRAVVCRSAAGSILADGACLASDGTATGDAKPLLSAPCTVASTCACTVDADCPSTRWACNTTSHRCVCSGRWGGGACDVPLLLPPSSAPPCSDGVVDINGTCSVGFIDSTTGISCPVSKSVDWAGRCCTAASVDTWCMWRQGCGHGCVGQVCSASVGSVL
jgi:hypothetical protein